MSEVTKILVAIESGNSAASEQLLRVVYDELRQLARQHMASERADHTLQPTALVHEAYLRLVNGSSMQVESRTRFFAAASEAMRRILIDHARRKNSKRQGEGAVYVPAEDDLIEYAIPDHSPEQLLDLNSALDRFSQVDATKAKLVELVFFAGLSLDEAADSLAISRATAYRYWTFSRAWLHDAIQGHSSTDATGTHKGNDISTIGTWNPS